MARAWTWLSASAVVVPTAAYEGRIINLSRPTVADIALGDGSDLVRRLNLGDGSARSTVHRLGMACLAGSAEAMRDALSQAGRLGA